MEPQSLDAPKQYYELGRYLLEDLFWDPEEQAHSEAQATVEQKVSLRGLLYRLSQ